MKPVSRQRLWQLQQRALGNCGLCGQPSGGKSHCLRCRKKNNDRQNQRRRRDPAAWREYVRKYKGYKRRYLGAASYHPQDPTPPATPQQEGH